MNEAFSNTLLGCGVAVIGKQIANRKPRFVTPILAASLALGMAGHAQAGSSGVPVDCVILLCMGGGFPSNPECNVAKAEVVRRVTPNPRSEPPLQIWSCPMGASYAPMAGPLPLARLVQIVGQDRSMGDVPNAGPTLVAGDDANTATLAFIRSIRVYNVMHYSYVNQIRDEGCSERWLMQLGSYGADGHYNWSGLHPAAVPDWAGLDRTCKLSSNYRGVAFEWTDYSGRHGAEVVRY